MVIMTWIKKYYGYVLLALGLLAVTGIYLWKRYGKNVDFDFNFGNIGGVLGALQNKVEGNQQNQKAGLYLQLPITTIIKNNKSSELNLRDALVELSYEGQKIMRTSPDSNGINANVKAKSSQPVTENVDVLINGKTLSFLKALAMGEKPKLDYKIKTKIFGVTYSFDSSKIIDQNQQL